MISWYKYAQLTRTHIGYHFSSNCLTFPSMELEHTSEYWLWRQDDNRSLPKNSDTQLPVTHRDLDPVSVSDIDWHWDRSSGGRADYPHASSCLGTESTQKMRLSSAWWWRNSMLSTDESIIIRSSFSYLDHNHKPQMPVLWRNLLTRPRGTGTIHWCPGWWWSVSWPLKAFKRPTRYAISLHQSLNCNNGLFPQLSSFPQAAFWYKAFDIRGGLWSQQLGCSGISICVTRS